jgi:TusA-related sulfurtransferase
VTAPAGPGGTDPEGTQAAEWGEYDAAMTLDCRGQHCPLPIIALARRISDLPIDSVIALLADDPAARSDVPAWCSLRGQDYLGERSTGQFLVRRRA